MGFSLKRTLKKVGGLLFGTPGSTGGMPDIGYLRDMSPYDYLLSDDPSKNIASRYWTDYINNVNAPSSVDEVRSGLNQEQLDLLLGNIERDTKNRFGTAIGDYFQRGLFTPGVGAGSDIASIGLAQLAAEGGRTAADARLRYALEDLDRLKERESAARTAYGRRYDYGNQLLNLYSGIQSDRDNLYANLMSGNFNAAQSRKNSTATPGVFSTFLDSFADEAGRKAGQVLVGGGSVPG